MGLQAVGKWVQLKVLKAPEKSAGGIFVPDVLINQQVRGEVVSVGEYHHRCPDEVAERSQQLTQIKVGDVVYYHQHAVAHRIKVDGEDMIFINPDEIYAVERK